MAEESVSARPSGPPPPEPSLPEKASDEPRPGVVRDRRIVLGVCAAIVALGVLAFVWTRSLLKVHGVGNPDIAGILYSADLIRAGLLPYRDSFDIKPPGTFFIVAAIFRTIGRSIHILHMAYAVWVASGAVAVALAARSLYGRFPIEGDPDASIRDGHRAIVAGSIAAALYLLSIGGFDMNYASWMTPPYAFAFAFMVMGLQRERARQEGWKSVVLHLLAGAFCTIAYLCKSQAVVLALSFVFTFFWARRRSLLSDALPGARYTVVVFWAAGALIALAPIVIFYGSRGALAELSGGLFPLGSAREYSARHVWSLRDLLLFWRVPYQQVKHFRVQIVFAIAALVSAIATFGSARGAIARERQAPIAPQLVFYAVSIIGCGLGGMRFYSHYLPQCLPALAILGAHPAGIDWLRSAFGRSSNGARTWLARAHALVAIVISLYGLGRIPFGLGTSLETRGSTASVKAGTYVRRHASADDRLLVWGWKGWGAYYYSRLRSPSPVFKVLGQVSDFNDNSILSRGSAIHFREGPMAERLLADVKAHRPAFIVRSTPFFPGTAGDPLNEFKPLRDIFERDYQKVTTFEDLTVYELKSHHRHRAKEAK